MNLKSCLGKEQKVSRGSKSPKDIREIPEYLKKKKGPTSFNVPTQANHKRQAGHSFTSVLQNETSLM